MCVERRGDTAFAAARCASKINQLVKNHKRGKCNVFLSNKQIACASRTKYFVGKFPTVRRAQG